MCSMDCCSEQNLSNCNCLLSADNHTVGDQPLLSPRIIVDAVMQLEALLNKLEPVVASIMKDIESKKLVKQGVRDFFVAYTTSATVSDYNIMR